MNKRLHLTILCCVIVYFLNAQDYNNTTTGITSYKTENNLFLGLDFTSRYIWRGQMVGGNYIAIQPTIEYAISNNLSVGIWCTTNFKKKGYNSDDTAKGYVELDLYLSYALNNFLSIELYDYYWPSLDNKEDLNNNFFNYGEDGVKTVDINLAFDFSEIWLPFNATISTLIAGNDFKYDKNDNSKRNFTTYLEVGYTFKNIIKTFNLSPTIGAVLNNEAEYYTYADYNKVSLVNLNLNLSKEFEINNNLVLPFSLQYIHNATDKNIKGFSKNFIVATLSLQY